MITIDLKSLMRKLNDFTRNALEGAAGLCLSRTQYSVEIEHWLIKLLEQDDSEIRYIFDNYEVDLDNVIRGLNNVIDGFKSGNSRPPVLSRDVINLAKNAWMLASVEYGHQQTSSTHILCALLLDEATHQQILNASIELKKIPAESLREFAKNVVGVTSESPPPITQDNRTHNDKGTPKAPSKSPALDTYTINLTERAKRGEIDPVLGRDQEIRQIVDVLTRRRQNNPILTGEAGVGKTAVVEGFALRIVANDVPEPLRHVCIHTLDLGLLQAGASIKGEFENRLKSVIAEVKASPIPIILFIDEAHTLIGAGGKEGQGDAANLLKPALARGDLRTIAATTWKEYKKYFEKDPALTRRFQVVKIEEPDENAAIEMMRGISQTLQAHHKVRIQDEAIVSAVKLSQRYIVGRQLPDKAVSLLDTACARVALNQSTTPASIEDLQRRLSQCKANTHMLEKEHATGGDCSEKLTALSIQKREIEQERSALMGQWEDEKRLVQEISRLRQELEKDYIAKKTADNDEDISSLLSDFEIQNLKNTLIANLEGLKDIQRNAPPLMQPDVDSQAVAEVVANWTGIPVGRMQSDEIKSLLNLKDQLNQRVIGQSHALEAIAKNIRTSSANLTDPRKPIGVFLMVGPSGVGKTETALALTELLYGGEQNLTVINMSEFKEEHKISMLLGSPPGYVGYGEGGVLTEAVRRKPYSVVLLDEMEKAHPGVQDIFYNLFDKGTIKDGEGRDIDFKNTVIIMTSNAGGEAISQICAAQATLPEPDVLLDSFRPELLKHFKPAFLGRCQVIAYYPLNNENLMAICEMSMQKIKKRVTSHYNAELSYDNDVPLHIVRQSQYADVGARSIESILTNTLLPELATECLSKLAVNEAINKIHIDVTDDGIFNYTIRDS